MPGTSTGIPFGSRFAPTRRHAAAAAGFAAASHVLYCGYDLIGRHETGHRLPSQGGRDRFHVLCVQPQSGRIGWWRRTALPALRAAGPARRPDHADPGTQRPYQLARLLAASPAACSCSRRRPCRPGGSSAAKACAGSARHSCSPLGRISPCAPSRGAREWRLRGHGAAPAFGTDCGAAAGGVGGELDDDRRRRVGAAAAQDRLPSVLGVLLVAAVAGVIAHVPAGLGVLEAVFIALLAHRVPQARAARRAAGLSGPLLPGTTGARVRSVPQGPRRARGRAKQTGFRLG